MRNGVVLFEEPGDVTVQGAHNGCYFLENADKPVWFDGGLVDLPTGTTWLTNMTSRHMFDIGLSGRPGLLHDGYLGQRLSNVFAELSLHDAALEQKGHLALKLFVAVCRSASEMFGVDTLPNAASIPHAVRQLILGASFQEPMSDEVAYGMDQASKAYGQSVRNMSMRKPVLLPFREHRQSYAGRLLSKPYPFGAWDPLDTNDPATLAHTVENEQESRPFLLAVSVDSIHDPFVAQTINFAHAPGVQRGKSLSRRLFISSVEYLELREFCDITIHRAMGAFDWAPSPFDGMRPRQFGPNNKARCQIAAFDVGGRRLLDYASGLLFEALWVSLLRSGRRADSLAVWTQAYDRVHCLRQALRVRNLKGLPLPVQVSTYGKGRLCIQIETCDGDLESFRETAARISQETGLICPVFPEAESYSERLRITDEIINTADMSDPAQVLRALAIYGSPRVMELVA